MGLTSEIIFLLVFGIEIPSIFPPIYFPKRVGGITEGRMQESFNMCIWIYWSWFRISEQRRNKKKCLLTTSEPGLVLSDGADCPPVFTNTRASSSRAQEARGRMWTLPHRSWSLCWHMKLVLGQVEQQAEPSGLVHIVSIWQPGIKHINHNHGNTRLMLKVCN